MKKITCLIADDEPMALSLIESYVLKTPFLELKAKCNNAIEAMQVLEEDNDIELFFLDIQMPDLSGLEFSKLVPQNSRVIFTTAFDQYAIDGYKVNALDYLLKPFDYNEFLSAATKARNYFESQQPGSVSKPEKKQEFFFIKSEYKQIKINFSEILYIEGLKDYAKIHLKDNPKPILTLMSLKKLEEELPSDNFMRIHRSFIIGLDKIEAIERNHIVIGKEQIAIAPNYKDALMEYIGGKSL
ncbi:LytR/AlgR family response regulator transcription factor [Epilithonimonas lactis]|uniref:Chemotaxis protein CheY n=1 Tax=Epilithonimonas lactis TaxID=421072 RepID=A0A085BFY8_9FLAO|nr:LytTR family DNA-binding domain-containing protein [Epilithonimonas lactis]KFC21383.1 chemotaxis protein CheY [Epilithonimonas lactis]SEP83435.1 two component transcriptional regulator, LytTR family [Epilithonimonas lactis]